ncbi:MAG: hypothetical protein IPO91_03080 [Chloroflexi bacterium]|nr:hypothetical protein [Chloroflexota bacterium]
MSYLSWISIQLPLQFNPSCQQVFQQEAFSMRLSSLRSAISQALNRVSSALKQSVKQCLQPANSHLVPGTLVDITRSKSELIAENAFLRHQLIVLQRQSKRPVLRRDRALLVILASRFHLWREALLIVKPITLLGWHHQAFRLFWRHRSKGRIPQPRVPKHVIALIHTHHKSRQSVVGFKTHSRRTAETGLSAHETHRC